MAPKSVKKREAEVRLSAEKVTEDAQMIAKRQWLVPDLLRRVSDARSS